MVPGGSEPVPAMNAMTALADARRHATQRRAACDQSDPLHREAARNLSLVITHIEDAQFRVGNAVSLLIDSEARQPVSSLAVPA